MSTALETDIKNWRVVIRGHLHCDLRMFLQLILPRIKVHVPVEPSSEIDDQDGLYVRARRSTLPDLSHGRRTGVLQCQGDLV